MKKIKEYTVWFEQVNQSSYRVRATTPEKALKRAKKYWRDVNADPTMVYVEDEDGNGVMR